MGRKELIDSLRKECEEKILALQEGFETGVRKIRDETSAKIREMSKEHERKETARIRSAEKDIGSNTLIKARKIRLMAGKSLSERLFPLVLSCLNSLRQKDYSDIFSSLARELPEYDWKEISVNPEDTDLASLHFPHVRITPEEDISGGIRIKAEDEKICIVNTFEKRLERAWDEMLPLLIKDINKAVTENESAVTDR